MNRRRSALGLAALLAGCSHPLPPRRAPGVWGPLPPDPSPPYPARLERPQAPALAPWRPVPPGTYAPPPAPGPFPPPPFPPAADPANPYPAPDPRLPPDARAT